MYNLIATGQDFFRRSLYNGRNAEYTGSNNEVLLMETGIGTHVDSASRANGMSDTVSPKLRLDSLEIRNFRLFRHLTLPELGSVNLIVGKNNSGKSCILEALYLYAERGSRDAIVRILLNRNEATWRRGVSYTPRSLSDDPMLVVKYLFEGRKELVDIDTQIDIGLIGQSDKKLSIGVEWVIESREADGTPRATPISRNQLSLLDVDANPIPRMVIRWGKEQRHFFRLPSSWPRRRPIELTRFVEPLSSVYVSSNGLSNEEINTLWDSITLTSLETRIVEALRLIHPGIEAVNIVGSDIQSERVTKIRLSDYADPLPLRSLGDGINRMFGIILALTNAQNGIALIDEIENGLHYSVQYEMWQFVFRLAKLLNIQVFATTHSWDCIEAFQKAATEDEGQNGMLIRLQRQGEDVVPTLFDERKLAIATRNQIEIR